MIEGILNTVSTENRPAQEVQRPVRKLESYEGKEAEKRKAENVDTDDAKKEKGNEVEQLIETLTNAARFFDRELRFELEKELDITIVKVIDAETEKVIRQIPPEELVELSKRNRDLKGLLIDTEG